MVLKVSHFHLCFFPMAERFYNLKINIFLRAEEATFENW